MFQVTEKYDSKWTMTELAQKLGPNSIMAKKIQVYRLAVRGAVIVGGSIIIVSSIISLFSLTLANVATNGTNAAFAHSISSSFMKTAFSAFALGVIVVGFCAWKVHQANTKKLTIKEATTLIEDNDQFLQLQEQERQQSFNRYIEDLKNLAEKKKEIETNLQRNSQLLQSATYALEGYPNL